MIRLLSVALADDDGDAVGGDVEAHDDTVTDDQTVVRLAARHQAVAGVWAWLRQSSRS